MARRDTEEEKQAEANAAEATTDDTGPATADTTTQANAATRIRRGLREPARVAADEYSGPVIGFVRDTVSGTLVATGTVATDAVETVRDVLTGTVHATEEVGTEALGLVGTLGTGIVTTVRDILVGSVGGVRQVLGSAAPSRASQTTEREPLHARDVSTS
ncbi:hypothetical protein OKW49_008478 [Paraburkholderia youngii]|uniref:hypothetical protein n=2 Tax=Paraburkholderia TaxID=1822464 RepID=UPI003D1F4D52